MYIKISLNISETTITYKCNQKVILVDRNFGKVERSKFHIHHPPANFCVWAFFTKLGNGIMLAIINRNSI